MIADFRLALSFLTRWPVSLPETMAEGAMARCMWAFPLIGALIGSVVGGVYLLACRIWPHAPSALIALTASLILTGALHEDGLADCADGFGGGRNKESTLAIMRDSRIGVYAALALIMSVLIRGSAIVQVFNPAGALIIAHTLSRTSLPIVMTLLPTASSAGLASSVGSPPRWTCVIAVILGLMPVLLAPTRAPLCIVVALISGGTLALLARKRIGGYSGDVLGAIQQVVEISVLLALLIRL